MNILLNYLTQATTWAGLVAIATALGVTLSPELAAEIVTVGTSVGGLLLVVFNERKDDVED